MIDALSAKDVAFLAALAATAASSARDAPTDGRLSRQVDASR